MAPASDTPDGARDTPRDAQPETAPPPPPPPAPTPTTAVRPSDASTAAPAPATVPLRKQQADAPAETAETTQLPAVPPAPAREATPAPPPPARLVASDATDATDAADVAPTRLEPRAGGAAKALVLLAALLSLATSVFNFAAKTDWFRFAEDALSEGLPALLGLGVVVLLQLVVLLAAVASGRNTRRGKVAVLAVAVVAISAGQAVLMTIDPLVVEEYFLNLFQLDTPGLTDFDQYVTVCWALYGGAALLAVVAALLPSRQVEVDDVAWTPRSWQPAPAASDPDAARRYFVHTGDAEQGPLTPAALTDRLYAGEVTPQTWVRDDAGGDWFPLAELRRR